MNEKTIDDMTIEELNRAVAIVQGWIIEKRLYEVYVNKNGNTVLVDNYRPCTNAMQAYEIIEREKISVMYSHVAKTWYADIDDHKTEDGETALIAAMRCFVKSKFWF
jgi:hypothetical protein